MSDSRYLTSDPFVLCMETVTAVRLASSLPTDRLYKEELTATRTGLLGSFILYCGFTDHHGTSSASSSPSAGVLGANLRRRSLLCDQYV